MLLHRVCPVDPAARPGRPYHPAYVPASAGQHRIDDPEAYDCLYLSADAAGAVAERFAAFPDWGDWLTDHPRGFTLCLVTFELPDDRPVLDLDDAAALAARGLRPSRVVTRDRATTQAWARAAYDEGRWAGVSWWSYHDPDWTTCGLWCAPGAGAVEGLDVVGVEALHAGHPAVTEAVQTLLRAWT